MWHTIQTNRRADTDCKGIKKMSYNKTIWHDTNNIHTEATLKHILDILRQEAETKWQQHDQVQWFDKQNQFDVCVYTVMIINSKLTLIFPSYKKKTKTKTFIMFWNSWQSYIIFHKKDKEKTIQNLLMLKFILNSFYINKHMYAS